MNNMSRFDFPVVHDYCFSLFLSSQGALLRFAGAGLARDILITRMILPHSMRGHGPLLQTH